MRTIKFKRGEKKYLPDNAEIGEPLFTTDTKELYIGTGDDSSPVRIGTQTKDIHFIVSIPSEGIHRQYAQLPYNGTIKSVNAYCSIDSDIKAEIGIDKISKEDFEEGNDTWESILSKNVIINPHTFLNDNTYEISNNKVNKNDFFRIVFVEPATIQRLTVQIQIEIDN